MSISARSRLSSLGPQLQKSRYLHNIPSLSTHNIQVSEEVREAVAAKQPVVALESTIYTHGLPYPENLKLAFHLSDTARKHGAIPATCAILDGIPRVGLDQEQLTRLIESKNAHKVSRRDLAYVTAKGLNGGSTIAGTMILSHLAGIHVFATGGLGGVHRGGENSLDISADLTELGRTPVAVVSSGPKGFLDIPRTLEYLETQGVHVSTFLDGRRGNVDFPAFWARDSGTRSPVAVRDEAEAAAIINAHLSMSLTSGLLFANPVPIAHSIPREDMAEIIERALFLADRAGATGNKNTPFVLNAIKELSGNRSVPANKALVEANVIRGARVAVELSKLQRGEEGSPRTSNFMPRFLGGEDPLSALNEDLHRKSLSSHSAPPTRQSPTKTSNTPSQTEILVAGSLAIDISCDYTPSAASPQLTTPQPHTSNPSHISDTLGGVGANIARAAHLLGANVRFCSAVADDLAGRGALQALKDTGLGISSIQILPSSTGARTARYVALNDTKKDLVMAMSDMSIIDNIPASTIQQWTQQNSSNSKPAYLILDANWSPPTLHAWLTWARTHTIPTVFEPVSVAKSTRLFTLPPTNSKPTTIPIHPTPLTNIITPNTHELSALYTHARTTGLLDTPTWWNCINSLGIPSTGARVALSLLTTPGLVDAGIPQRALQLLPFVPTILTKLGAQGVLLTMLLSAHDARLSSPEAAEFILSRSGTEHKQNDGGGIGGVYMRLLGPAEVVAEEEVVGVSGCGDTFCGALVAGLVRRGSRARVEDVVMEAQRAAVCTLKSRESVGEGLMGMSVG